MLLLCLVPNVILLFFVPKWALLVCSDGWFFFKWSKFIESFLCLDQYKVKFYWKIKIAALDYTNFAIIWFRFCWCVVGKMKLMEAIEINFVSVWLKLTLIAAISFKRIEEKPALKEVICLVLVLQRSLLWRVKKCFWSAEEKPTLKGVKRFYEYCGEADFGGSKKASKKCLGKANFEGGKTPFWVMVWSQLWRK